MRGGERVYGSELNTSRLKSQHHHFPTSKQAANNDLAQGPVRGNETARPSQKNCEAVAACSAQSLAQGPGSQTNPESPGQAAP